jgi:histidinol-phosphate aminotransferase
MQNQSINPRIAGLSPYKPGKPVEEVARELGINDIVKLASNENPRGPGAKVQRAIAEAATELSRYPDGGGFALKARLSEKIGVEASQLTLGNGSNDVLDLIARVVLEPGAQAIIAEHSFVVYRLAVTCCGGDLVTVPARDYGADLVGMLAAVTDATRLIFIANPNNPTGTRTPGSELLPFLQAVPEHVWVVLDEAYLEYVEDEDHVNGATLLAQFPNLIVTRTFSKVYGLAAVRFGYGASSPAFADLLNRARQPFNVNSLAMAASLAALEDDDYVKESVALNRAGMTQMTEGLTRLGYDFIPSAGNFVAFNCAEPGQDLFQRLLQEGVIVRAIGEYGLPNHVRVSIGLESENERFLSVLAKVGAHAGLKSTSQAES